MKALVSTTRYRWIGWVVLLFPVIWAALLAAPFVSQGLLGMLRGFTEAMNDPFHIRWVEDTPRCMLFFVAAYGMGIVIYLSTRHNYRKREEHGSARWGIAAAINRKYRDRNQRPLTNTNGWRNCCIYCINTILSCSLPINQQ